MLSFRSLLGSTSPSKNIVLLRRQLDCNTIHIRPKLVKKSLT